MYTVTSLQEKLEKAKITLREVEQSISGVDGKPYIFGQRFSKNDERGWDNGQKGINFRRHVVNNQDDSTLQRRRVSAVEESYSRRRVIDESSRSYDFDVEAAPRRRPAALSSDDGPPRKRLFPSVQYDDQFEDGELSPERQRVQSTVGKVNMPDLSLTLKSRGRHNGEEDRPRSIFSRLSGQHHQREENNDEEDEQILKRDAVPSLASRVQAIERPSLSREQVLASQSKDEASKQRDRRMFGALVGTLQKFRREETQVKEREERRMQIEKKLEADALKDRERLAEEKRTLLNERKRREGDIKRIEWSLNRVKEFAEWQVAVQPLKGFIQTRSKPQLFYMPKRLNAKTQQLLEESAHRIEGVVENHVKMLNEEIEASERKSRRAAGGAAADLEHVDKENDDGNLDMHGKNDENEEKWPLNMEVREEADAATLHEELVEQMPDTGAAHSEAVEGSHRVTPNAEEEPTSNGADQKSKSQEKNNQIDNRPVSTSPHRSTNALSRSPSPHPPSHTGDSVLARQSTNKPLPSPTMDQAKHESQVKSSSSSSPKRKTRLVDSTKSRSPSKHAQKSKSRSPAPHRRRHHSHRPRSRTPKQTSLKSVKSPSKKPQPDFMDGKKSDINARLAKLARPSRSSSRELSPVKRDRLGAGAGARNRKSQSPHQYGHRSNNKSTNLGSSSSSNSSSSSSSSTSDSD